LLINNVNRNLLDITKFFLRLKVAESQPTGLLLTCAIRFLLECGMDWKNIIEEIQAAGFSQTEIADYVGKSQAWVSAIAQGKVADVRYSDGSKLLSMRAMPPARHAA
jgi:hypothetical protein